MFFEPLMAPRDKKVRSEFKLKPGEDYPVGGFLILDLYLTLKPLTPLKVCLQLL